MSGRPAFVIHSSDVREEEGHYPAPFDAERLSFGRNLGKAAGSVQVGLWQERLPPGRRTSFTHAHSHEEELLYVLSGACHVRIVEPGQAPREVAVESGDCISFPAGTGIAHCAVNRTDADCVLLCFGERRPETDRCAYPEDSEYERHLREQRPERFWNREEAATGGPRLTTDRLLITMLGPGDASRVATFYEENRAHLAPWEPTRPDGFYSEAYWERRLRENRRMQEEGREVRWFLLLRDSPDGPVVGDIGLTQIHRGPLQSATLGYALDHRHVGRGLMTEAARAVVAYAFDTLRLHRVQAGYVPTNERSARVLERLGFEKEGYAREYLYVGGAWQDHVQTGLVRPDPSR